MAFRLQISRRSRCHCRVGSVVVHSSTTAQPWVLLSRTNVCSFSNFEKKMAQEVRWLAKAREKFLKQKGVAKWMQGGDMNHKVFHNSIKFRTYQNAVNMIEDMRGHRCEETEQGLFFVEQSSNWKTEWCISSKTDVLWVKWICEIYMKNTCLWEYELNGNVSAYWRDICSMRSVLQMAYPNGKWDSTQGIKYTASLGYKILRGGSTRVPWTDKVWNCWNVPKHSVITWLFILNRLKTRDRLRRMGICADKLCLLCDQEDESAAHIFFVCPYSQQVWIRMTDMA